jgi:molybdopterin-guanine dinucleotide biosynthesis protein MobB
MILGVAGYQDSGKTTLMEIMIQRIVQAGFSVGTVKHIAHDNLRVDGGGTDTDRHKRAGAKIAVAMSDTETVYLHREWQSLEDVLARLEKSGEFDLVLVEGFKASPLPKIVVGDVEHGGPEKFRWDGTEPDANRIAERLMEEIRAKRARNRTPRTRRRHPRAGGRNAAARSAIRGRRSPRAGRRRP